MFKKEIWKDILGYEGHYQVSNKGRVKSLQRMINTITGPRIYREMIRKKSLDKDGYERVLLHDTGLTNIFPVHRLVLFAFSGPSDLQVNHKNGIRSDNRLENLEFVSNLENINHRYITLRNQKRYGVHFNKNTEKWRVVISSKHIGLFTDKDEAYDVFYFVYTLMYGVTPW